ESNPHPQVSGMVRRIPPARSKPSRSLQWDQSRWTRHWAILPGAARKTFADNSAISQSGRNFFRSGLSKIALFLAAETLSVDPKRPKGGAIVDRELCPERFAAAN